MPAVHLAVQVIEDYWYGRRSIQRFNTASTALR